MKHKKEFLNFVKNLDWKQMIILFLFQLMPTIYKTIRIFFLGSLPDKNAYNIASQILWLNILYEIIIESIIVPIFFVFEKIFKNTNEEQTNIGRFFTLITIIIFGIFLLFTIIIFFNIPNIVSSFDFVHETKLKTIEYIQFEVFGMFFFSIMFYLFLTIYLFKIEKYNTLAFIVVLLYMFINLILDVFFISSLPISLKLGINGIGINSIISNSLISIILLIYLSCIKTKIFTFKNIFQKNNYLLKYLKQYLFLWIMSAFEVLIRNLIFYFMVLLPINQRNDSGVYWVANNFIWGWLLMPITTLSSFIKINYISLKDCLNNNFKVFKYQISFYFLFTTIIIIFWFGFLWVNPFFIKVVLGAKDIYSDVNKLVLILIGFYVLFSYGMIMDSIFIKTGRVWLYLIQSSIVNFTIYPIFFILWKINLWIPTLESISIMFGLGMAMHFIINIVISCFILKKNNVFKNELKT